MTLADLWEWTAFLAGVLWASVAWVCGLMLYGFLTKSRHGRKPGR